MKLSISKSVISGLLACASAAASAFTPAGGLWGFTNELNGQPGRGFQLVVENDVLVFYYYGYNSDGSGNYMFASGPLTGGTAFNEQLLVCRGGTLMGSPYKPASCSDGPGRVTLSFTSGEKGTIILPGEAPKPINRFNFGYADGPDALLGEFLFAYKARSFNNADIYTLVTKTGIKTIQPQGVGTGLVVDASSSMGCEYYPVANEFRDIYLCTELKGDENDDVYIFRMVGDRGVGWGTWYGSPGATEYPAHVVRLATKKGTRTGPHAESYNTYLRPKALPVDPVPTSEADNLAKLREGSDAIEVDNPSSSEIDFAREWAAQARAIMAERKNK